MRLLEETTQDIRLALRSLIKEPILSASVIFVMALGLGTAVAMFTYFAYFHFNTLPAPDPEEVVYLQSRYPEGGTAGISHEDFRTLENWTKDRESGFEQVAGSRLFGVPVRDDQRNRYHTIWAVSGDYFGLFGARAQVGRLPGPSDDHAGAEPVVVLSEPVWKKYFAADPEVIGLRLELDNRLTATVVGVAPKGFQGTGLAAGLYMPLATAVPLLQGIQDPENRSIRVLARLPNTSSLEQMQQETASFSQGLDSERPLAEGTRDLHLEPAHSFAWQDGEDELTRGADLLFASVGFLLLLACFNIALMLTARAESRHRELSIHAALGAGSGRIARRLLIEGIILASIGGGIGLKLSDLWIQVMGFYLLAAVPVGFGDWGLGSSIFADQGLVSLFFLALTFGVAVLCSLLPMSSVFRADLAAGVGRTISPSSWGGRRWARALVVLQVALAVILCSGALLLTRTLIHVGSQELGFDTHNRHVAMLAVPKNSPGAALSSDDSEDYRHRLYASLLDQTRRLNGVRSVALLTSIPPTRQPGLDVNLPSGKGIEKIHQATVSDGYFRTLEIPFLAGRDFDATDDSPSTKTVILSRPAAELLWPGENAVGRFLTLNQDGDEGGPAFRVIGVTAPTREHDPKAEPAATAYFHYAQRMPRRLGLVAHADGEFLQSFVPFLSRTSPETAIRDIAPLAEQVRRASSDQRMYSHLGSAFAFLGLVLAVTGIFAVTRHGVGRRAKEMAIRRALGASSPSVSLLILRETGVTLAVGITLGFIGAALISGLIQGLIYGVELLDPVTPVAVGLLVAGAALGASWWPARKVAKRSPALLLRND